MKNRLAISWFSQGVGGSGFIQIIMIVVDKNILLDLGVGF